MNLFSYCSNLHYRLLASEDRDDDNLKNNRHLLMNTYEDVLYSIFTFNNIEFGCYINNI